MVIDKAALLAHIKTQSDRFGLVAGAVLDALAARIRDGDFDTERSE